MRRSLSLTAFAALVVMWSVAADDVKTSPALKAPTKVAAQAATLKIVGKLNVDEYKLVILSAEGVPPDAVLLWDVIPEDKADIKEESDGSLVFVGPPGVYKIKLRAISGRVVSTARETVIIGKLNPAPGPGPTPDPGPQPNPMPKGAVVAFVVVEETEDAGITRGKMLTDAALATFVKENKIKFKVIDKNAVGPDGKPLPDEAAYLAHAKDKKLPWLMAIDKDGNWVVDEAAPTDPVQFLKLLRGK